MSEPTIHRPADAGQLREIVAWAVAEGQPLEIAGNGTKRILGRPVEAEHLVSVASLSGITLYEPDELVMSAGAGTPLAVIEAELAERGQELMFEPADYGALLGADAGSQTIGGVFAANVAGPRRLKSGAARDHLLGLHCVTGHAQEIKTGGRVVKNVTGYDLCKLLTGSWGTLAVLTQVTFKVMPRAEDALTLLATGADEAALLGAAARGQRQPVRDLGCRLPAAAGRRPLAGQGTAPPCARHGGDPARGLRAVDRLPQGPAWKSCWPHPGSSSRAWTARIRRRCGARSATSRCCTPSACCGASPSRPRRRASWSSGRPRSPASACSTGPAA